MTADPAILAARARVIASKAQLDASIAQAKDRLSPRSLAADAVDSAAEKASQVAHSGVEIVRERPVATAAVVGAIGLTIAHKPVLGWIASLFGRGDATADSETS